VGAGDFHSIGGAPTAQKKNESGTKKTKARLAASATQAPLPLGGEELHVEWHALQQGYVFRGVSIDQ
jgi:hypothetical protein